MTNTAGDDDDPSYSPDGSQIVFISNTDGDYDLYLMDSNGTSINKIIDTHYDELSPVWLQ